MKCDHCNQFDACNDLTRKEDDMYALVELTCQAKEMSVRELFRLAYWWRFEKDPPMIGLSNDIKKFRENYNTPPYVTDYMVHLYGPV